MKKGSKSGLYNFFGSVLRFYSKNSPRNSWSLHFMITLWNQKSQNAGTSCSTYLGYITLGLAFSGLPSPSPSLFSAWFYLRLKDKMKISRPFSNQVSLTGLWTIWIDEYLKGKFIIDVRKLKKVGPTNRSPQQSYIKNQKYSMTSYQQRTVLFYSAFNFRVFHFWAWTWFLNLGFKPEIHFIFQFQF